jgi:4-oxalocrotonate tautomerase family enzyme
MPLISIRLVAGRDTAQIRTLVAKVSEAAAQALDVPLERVGVHVIELPADRVGRGGQLASDSEARP